MEWSPNCHSDVTRTNYQMAYRTLQVWNKHINTTFSNVCFFNLCTGIIVQVIQYIFLIRMRTKMPFISLISFMILIGWSSINIFVFGKTLKTRQDSIEYTQSYLRGEQIRKIDKVFFTSCTPLELWIGSFFTIKKKSFSPEVFCVIIIQIVAHILITSR